MAYQTIRFMFPTWSDWEVSWTRKRQRVGWPTFICACLVLALGVTARGALTDSQCAHMFKVLKWSQNLSNMTIRGK